MVDEEMRKALICLLKRFNGRWKVSDFEGLIAKWEEENKLMLYKHNINWIYNPELVKKLNAITIKTKTRKSGSYEEQNNSNEKQLGAIKELEKALVLSKALNDKNIESYLKNRIIELKEGASIK